jgi:hypothetical protein
VYYEIRKVDLEQRLVLRLKEASRAPRHRAEPPGLEGAAGEL